jgi:CBS domain-containing protein
MVTDSKIAERLENNNSELFGATFNEIGRAELQEATAETNVELVLDFIAASQEQLKSAEDGLNKLKIKPDDKDVLNQIFRAFNTIKGMAWFLNLTDVGSLAHSAENLLGLALKGELIFGGNNIQAVAASIDMLGIVIINLKKSTEPSRANSRAGKYNTQTFIAGTVMTTDVISVKRQTAIYDAIKILSENNITGMPVVNDDMSIAGIVSEKDVLKLLYDVETRTGRVEDFMTKGVVSFNIDDSLIDITECLTKNSFRRVPITAEGKLVGIISRRDIIEYILKLRKKDKACQT